MEGSHAYSRFVMFSFLPRAQTNMQRVHSHECTKGILVNRKVGEYDNICKRPVYHTHGDECSRVIHVCRLWCSTTFITVNVVGREFTNVDILTTATLPS